MEIIFQLLGKILDDLTQEYIFSVDYEDGAAILETINTEVIDTHILPLFGDEKVDERHEIIEHDEHYYATIKISQGAIVEVGLGNGLNYITCDVSTKILRYLKDIGFSFNETYALVCTDITKKCEYLVDNANMM